MRRIAFLGLVTLALIVATLWAANLDMGPLVINRESDYRMVLRFGQPVLVMSEPGIGFRIPFLDTTRKWDSRLQHLDADPVEMLISGGEKLIVDYFVVWKVGEPEAFMKSFPTGMAKAEDRIQSEVNALVGEKIGALSLDQILQRAEILAKLAAESDVELGGLGLEIVDVRLNRTELPRNAEPAAYEQMREQRRAIARAQRVRGERDARTIRAEAEGDARTTRAKAKAESEVLRGQGDAESARTYADAYNRDPEFYAFVRSLEAYRKSLTGKTTMVLPPDHEFFRFLDLNGSAGGAVKAPGAQRSE